MAEPSSPSSFPLQRRWTRPSIHWVLPLRDALRTPAAAGPRILTRHGRAVEPDEPKTEWMRVGSAPSQRSRRFSPDREPNKGLKKHPSRDRGAPPPPTLCLMISSADTEQLIQELAELRSERRWTERVREDLVHAAAADQHMRGSAERKRA